MADGSEIVAILEAAHAHAAQTGDDAIGVLLDRWQTGGEEAVLRHLLATVTPLVERTVASVLRRSGIRDPSTHDEAVTLVFDHLRRLRATTAEPHVAAFRTQPSTPAASGEAFIVRLAQDRARDAVRAFRRRGHRCSLFSQLQADEAAAIGHRPRDAWIPADSALAGEDVTARLHAAIEQLEPRHREVVLLLIEGKNQAVIAHMVGVCEGTVSRIRRQAIDRLRTLLAAEEQ